MSDPVYAYRADQDLAAMPFEWLDRDGTIIDFSAGWTFTVHVAAATAPTAILHTKTAGITGAATLPNVIVDWAVTDMPAIATALGDTLGDAGVMCVIHLYARRGADSKDRVFRPANPPTFRLLPAPA